MKAERELEQCIVIHTNYYIFHILLSGGTSLKDVAADKSPLFILIKQQKYNMALRNTHQWIYWRKLQEGQ